MPKSTESKLDSYCNKKLQEQLGLKPFGASQLIREFRDTLRKYAAWIDSGFMSESEAYAQIDKMIEDVYTSISRRWEEAPIPEAPSLIEEERFERGMVPEELHEVTMPRGYLLSELTRGERPRAIRMILARYWKEIAQNGLYEFFNMHPVFGVDYLSNELLNEFVYQIHARYTDRRRSLSYRSDVRMPFMLEIVTGMDYAKLLIKRILLSGVGGKNFIDDLAAEFESYYGEIAYIRGYHAIQSLSPWEFASAFGQWIVNNPPILPPAGLDTEERRL